MSGGHNGFHGGSDFKALAIQIEAWVVKASDAVDAVSDVLLALYIDK